MICLVGYSAWLTDIRIVVGWVKGIRRFCMYSEGFDVVFGVEGLL